MTVSANLDRKLAVALGDEGAKNELLQAIGIGGGDTTLNATDIDAGASGTAGTLDIFPSTAAKGKTQLAAANNAGDTTNTITNASQAAARTFTIPDPGASANFKMEAAQALTADGAVTIKDGYVTLDKAGVLAATLADPTTGTDNGKCLQFIALTAQAHTVTIAGGLNGAGAGKDVATFGGAIGDTFTVRAHAGKWYLVTATNVTFA